MVANRTVSTADQAATAQMTADALATGKFASTYQHMMDECARLMAARATLTAAIQANAPEQATLAADKVVKAAKDVDFAAMELRLLAVTMGHLYAAVADYRATKAQPARAEAEDVEPFDDMTGPMEGGAA